MSFKHEYGCAMLYFNFPQIESVHKLIHPSDIYNDPEDPSYGLETEPHITLLFGLHPEVGLDDVKKTIQQFQYAGCKLHKPSCFNNEKYDVFKYDVDAPYLHEINNTLKQFPHTSNFPNYHPHMTIAYLNKNCADKYIKPLKTQSFTVKPSHAVYSMVNGEKHNIDIKIENL